MIDEILLLPPKTPQIEEYIYSANANLDFPDVLDENNEIVNF